MLMSGSEDWVAAPWSSRVSADESALGRGETPLSSRAHCAQRRGGPAFAPGTDEEEEGVGSGWVCWVLWNICVASACNLDCKGPEGLGRAIPRSHSAGLSELEEASDPHSPPFRRKQPLCPSPIMMQKRGKVPLALITYPVCHP